MYDSPVLVYSEVLPRVVDRPVTPSVLMVASGGISPGVGTVSWKPPPCVNANRLANS